MIVPHFLLQLHSNKLKSARTYDTSETTNLTFMRRDLNRVITHFLEVSSCVTKQNKTKEKEEAIPISPIKKKVTDQCSIVTKQTENKGMHGVWKRL